MKKNRNGAVTIDIPEYETLKEIIVKGTETGGDKRQYMFAKNGVDHERTYNETWREICGFGTYLYSHGLRNREKIAIIGENCSEWMIAYYACIAGGDALRGNTRPHPEHDG